MKQLTIWAFGDTHVRDPLPDFDAILADMENNVPFDIGIGAGDLVNLGSVLADFQRYRAGILGIDNLRQAWFHVGGNHDYNGALVNYKAEIMEETLYSVVLGNLLFILMSDESSTAAGDYGDPTFNWWRDLVVANQDKIIITVAHHPLYETTGIGATNGSDTANYYVLDSARFSDVLQGYNVDLWIHGHCGFHIEATEDSMAEKWGTLHMSVAIHPNGLDNCSRVLRFVERSNIVNVKLRNHTDGAYTESCEMDFQLSHRAKVTGADGDGLEDKFFPHLP